MMTRPLAEQTVVITGASSGIGRAAAILYPGSSRSLSPSAYSASPQSFAACRTVGEDRYAKWLFEVSGGRGFWRAECHLFDLTGGATVTVAPPVTSGLGNPQWACSWKS